MHSIPRRIDFMNEDANKLFVEAALLLRQCDGLAVDDVEKFAEKATLALSNFDRILTDHSGSSVAVDTVLGRTPFNLTLLDSLRVRLAKCNSIIAATQSPRAFLLLLVSETARQGLDVKLSTLGYALAASGAFEDATSLATQVGDEEAAALLSGIAVGLAQRGDSERAGAISRQALAHAMKIEAEFRSVALSDVAWACAARGALDEALSIANQIGEDDSREKARDLVYTTVVNAGGVDAVRQATQSLSSEGRMWIELDIARTLRARGEHEGTLKALSRAAEAATTISYEYARDVALGGIAQEYAYAQDLQRAAEVAGMIGTLSIKGEALCALATILAKEGEAERSISVFEDALASADASSRREEVLNTIAASFASLGDFPALWRVQSRFRPTFGYHTLVTIARALASSEDPDAIESALQARSKCRKESEVNCCRFRSSIALAEALRGNRFKANNRFGDCTCDAEGISNAADATRTLIFIASQQLLAGEVTQARETFRRAWRAANQNEGEADASEDDEGSTKEAESRRDALRYIWWALGPEPEWDWFSDCEDEETWNDVVVPINMFKELLRLERFMSAYEIASGIADFGERYKALATLGYIAAVTAGRCQEAFMEEEKTLAVRIARLLLDRNMAS